MTRGMKMLMTSRSHEGDGRSSDYRGERMGDVGEMMRRSGADRFEMRYDRIGRDGERRSGEIGYDRMNYGDDMRRGYNRMDDEEMRYAGDGVEEMRRGRRRYKNGRFAPESRYYPPEYGGDNDMEEMNRYSGYVHEPMNNYPEQRRPGAMENKIGFRMGEDGHAGGTLTFPENHMVHREKVGRLDKETAETWVEHMRNEDGTKGAHWTMEQTEQVRKQKNLNCDPLEFWVAMNAAYSDLSKVAKKHNANTIDYYVDYVKAFWFNDQDSVPNKLAAYYDAIVRK